MNIEIALKNYELLVNLPPGTKLCTNSEGAIEYDNRWLNGFRRTLDGSSRTDIVDPIDKTITAIIIHNAKPLPHVLNCIRTLKTRMEELYPIDNTVILYMLNRNENYVLWLLKKYSLQTGSFATMDIESEIVRIEPYNDESNQNEPIQNDEPTNDENHDEPTQNNESNESNQNNDESNQNDENHDDESNNEPNQNEPNQNNEPDEMTKEQCIKELERLIEELSEPQQIVMPQNAELNHNSIELRLQNEIVPKLKDLIHLHCEMMNEENNEIRINMDNEHENDQDQNEEIDQDQNDEIDETNIIIEAFNEFYDEIQQTMDTTCLAFKKLTSVFGKLFN